MTAPLLSFFGDDFTGSTDALELLATAGLRTKLFTRVPTAAEVAGLDAYGVAGETRAMRADALERTLRDVLPKLAALPARLVHYKVCSTFDSSPDVGSIGRAIDVAFDVFRPRYVPVVAAAPSLGRYSAFGHLFARYGGDGQVFRLDRHPSISRHPVTPMIEADIGVHLSQQTARPLKLLDFRHFDGPEAESFRLLQGHDGAAVLFDLLREADLPRLGAMLDRPDAARFVVGSSGVESALLTWWAQTSLTPALSHGSARVSETRSSSDDTTRPGPSKAQADNRPILVVCGSCSPVSAAQVRHAVEQGAAETVIDVTAPAAAHIASDAARPLRTGQSVVVHTAGCDERRGVDRGAIGRLVGDVTRRVLSDVRVSRVVVAGGDTSGAIARALDIASLEMAAPLVRGAPIVRAAAPGSPADGVEFVFKGGQVGAADFFVQAGAAESPSPAGRGSG
jgi:uncharacterized protein YgbK (DUF1537 family)